MNRISVYARDEYGDPGTDLAGWFNADKAECWVDMDYERTGRGENLYRTAQARWVLDGTTGRCVYLLLDEAREWLLASGKDAAIAKYFGPIPEEEDRRPGRPAIGEPVNVRLGELLSRVDAFAAERGVSRADAIRELVTAGLAGQ